MKLYNQNQALTHVLECNHRLSFCTTMVNAFHSVIVLELWWTITQPELIFRSTNTWLLQMIWWCIKHYLIKLIGIKTVMVKRNQAEEKWLHDVNFNLVFIKHNATTETELRNKITITLYSFMFKFIVFSHAYCKLSVYIFQNFKIYFAKACLIP